MFPRLPHSCHMSLIPTAQTHSQVHATEPWPVLDRAIAHADASDTSLNDIHRLDYTPCADRSCPTTTCTPFSTPTLTHTPPSHAHTAPSATQTHKHPCTTNTLHVAAPSHQPFSPSLLQTHTALSKGASQRKQVHSSLKMKILHFKASSQVVRL